MVVHESPFDYLAGCRLPACVRAREERVRRYCYINDRPLPADITPMRDFTTTPEHSQKCDRGDHEDCSGWWGLGKGRRDGLCICACHA